MSYEPDVIAAYERRTDRGMIRRELDDLDLEIAEIIYEAGMKCLNGDVWATSSVGILEFREGGVYLRDELVYEG